MSFALSLGELEAALASLHDVAPDRRHAFQARIKHLQKLGFPPGTNTGKGKRAAYDLEAIAKLVGAFELMQFGLMPTAAARLIETNWPFLKVSVASALHEMLLGYEDGMFGLYWVWVFNPQALSDLTEGASENVAACGACRVKDAEKAIWEEWRDDEEGLMPEIGRGYRHMLINISWALSEFLNDLRAVTDLDLDAVSDDLDGWRFDRENYEQLEGDIGRWGKPFFAGRIYDASDPQA